MKRRNIFLFLLIFCFVLLCALYIVAKVAYAPSPVTHMLSIVDTSGNHTDFSITIASTEADRVKGLSNSEPLSPDEGLLFVFDTSDVWGIWMKDMNFSIDIVWIDENKRVIDIKKSVHPESFPEIFFPQAPSRYVLEILSGIVEQKGIEVGDTVLF